jgi:hypothetical protein
MVIPLICFLLDFIFFAIFGVWHLRLLLIYLIFIFCMQSSNSICTKNVIFGFLFLILQDAFLYNRSCLCFVYLIPMMFFVFLIKMFCDIKMLVFRYLILFGALLLEFLIIKKWIFVQNVSLKSTFFSIGVNMIIMILVSIGTRDNRFLRT